MTIPEMLLRASGAVLCTFGSHDARPFRPLTRMSREFQCIRCEKRWVDVREDWVGWALRGAHPYGEGEDSLGESIAWRGRTLEKDKVLQTPYPRWNEARLDWLGRISTTSKTSTKPSPSA